MSTTWRNVGLHLTSSQSTRCWAGLGCFSAEGSYPDPLGAGMSLRLLRLSLVALLAMCLRCWGRLRADGLEGFPISAIGSPVSKVMTVQGVNKGSRHRGLYVPSTAKTIFVVGYL